MGDCGDNFASAISVWSRRRLEEKFEEIQEHIDTSVVSICHTSCLLILTVKAPLRPTIAAVVFAVLPYLEEEQDKSAVVAWTGEPAELLQTTVVALKVCLEATQT